LQAQLKESQTNLRALQQHIEDMEKNKKEEVAKADAVVVVEAKKKIAKMKKKKTSPIQQNAADEDVPRPMTEEQIAFHRRCKEKREYNALRMAEIERDVKRIYDEMYGDLEGQGSANAKRKKKGSAKVKQKTAGSAQVKQKTAEIAEVKQKTADSAEKTDAGVDEEDLCTEAVSNCDGSDDQGAPEEAVYNIERFLKLKTAQGKVSILVRWEGGENSWEPEENLRSDLGEETVDEMITEMKMVSTYINSMTNESCRIASQREFCHFNCFTY